MIYEYVIEGQEITLLRCLGKDRVIELPGRIGGLPVTGLADHMFAASPSSEYRKEQILRTEEDLGPEAEAGAAVSDPEEVILPETMRRIGSYAFYGCRSLRQLTLPFALASLGRGVFTACNHIENIRFKTPEEEDAGEDHVSESLPEGTGTEGRARIPAPPCLRSILGELEYELTISFLRKGEETVRLRFPGYYEDSVENTPARIIEVKFEGTGFKYRQCFEKRYIDLGQYDGLFYVASVQEQPSTAGEIALGRLAFPVGLTEKHREEYVTFLQREEHRCMEAVAREDDPDYYLQALAGAEYFDRDRLGRWIDWFAGRSRMREVSLLMDVRKRLFPVKEKEYLL